MRCYSTVAKPRVYPFFFNVSFENFYILIIASRRRIEFEQYRLKEKGGGNAFTTMKTNFPFLLREIHLETWEFGDGSRERRIIRKELRCINLKGSVMNACVEKIYISDVERTNRSFHSFHSIAFSENKEGGRKQRLRTGTNSIKKKKKYDKLFLLLHSRERYNNVIQRNYITFSR